MKKGLIGIFFCTLLVAVSFVPMASAQTGSSGDDSATEPPQPAGFGKFDFTDGFGIRLWGWCTTENYNSMTLEWDTTQGGSVRAFPIIKHHSSWNGGIKFFYWYAVHSITKKEFVLHIHYQEDGSTETIALTGKVMGYLVWGLQPS